MPAKQQLAFGLRFQEPPMIRGSLGGRSNSFGKLGINLVSEILASGTPIGTLKWDHFSTEDL
jgi:hypothetical protein